MAYLTAKQKCSVMGNDIAYYREGQGPPVIFLHGITTYSFLWREIVPYFREDFEIIAFDLLGSGDSDKPLDISYSLKSHAGILKEFTQALGIEKFHLVAHDLGGGIGQIFAVDHPEMLHSLTLINSVAYDYWPVQPITAMRTPIIRQIAMASLDIGAFRLIIKRGLYHKEHLTDELMAAFFLPMKTVEGRKAFLHFAKSLDNQDLTSISDELTKLQVSTLIIRGDADVYLSSEISKQLHQNLPNSRYEAIETGGHFIQIDEPELLAHTILSFINWR